MINYRVKRGPVSPPSSVYRQRRTLNTGDTLRSAENPWIRACLRDGRLELASSKRTKRTKSKGDNDAR